MRDLNKAIIIGNLTKDPELKELDNNVSICSFSVATNREWTTKTGEKKEDVVFHRVVAWDSLAKICKDFLYKGRKVYVEGRMAHKRITTKDGKEVEISEIVAQDVIMLSRRTEDQHGPEQQS